MAVMTFKIHQYYGPLIKYQTIVFQALDTRRPAGQAALIMLSSFTASVTAIVWMLLQHRLSQTNPALAWPWGLGTTRLSLQISSMNIRRVETCHCRDKTAPYLPGISKSTSLM